MKRGQMNETYMALWIAPAIARLAREYKLPYIDFHAAILEKFGLWAYQGWVIKKYLYDGVHCTRLGYRLLARRIHEMLCPAVYEGVSDETRPPAPPTLKPKPTTAVSTL
jgi:lysophospholipase L1-like esterase